MISFSLRSKNRRRLASMASALFLGLATQLFAGQPKTIPALREWKDAEGSFTYASTTRICFDAQDSPQLEATATTLADDLSHIAGATPPIARSVAGAQNGDIVLALNATDPALGQEGYLMEIGGQVIIRATTEPGAFYGTRSLLQMLRQGLQIQAGSARDWPDYPERAMMVDVGRKYYTVDWLNRHIKELAYLKLNVLHLHLSDLFHTPETGYGFRLESKTHPEITSPEHYTSEEIQSLLALAKNYHVQIIPEIDMPSHATPLLMAHPELALPATRSDHLPEKLDLSKPETWTLVKEILDEFVPQFPGPWHMGGDEYLAVDQYATYPQLLSYAQQLYGPSATAADLTIGFANYVDDIVKSHGRTTRAFNDLYAVPGAINTPHSDIALDLWTPDGIQPQEALAKGHQITNSGLFTLYYVLAGDYGQVFTNDPANIVNLYENWAPHKQWVSAWDSSAWPQLKLTYGPDLAPQTPGLLGGKFFVWSDLPDYQTEIEVQQGIAPHLRGLAQSCWGSPKLQPTYDAFRFTVVEPVGHAPGWTPDYSLIAPTSAATISAGQTATFQVFVNPMDGFGQPVQLTCLNNGTVSPTIRCVLSSASVTPISGNSAPFTISIQTMAPTLASARELAPPPGALGGLMCGLLAPGLLLNSRRKRYTAFLCGLICAMTMNLGCTSKHPPQPTIVPGTPAGTYTFELKGISGSLAHSIQFQVIVRND